MKLVMMKYFIKSHTHTHTYIYIKPLIHSWLTAPIKSETRNVVWLLFIGVPAGTIHILLSTEIHRRRINVSVHDVTGGKIGDWFPVLGGLFLSTIIVPRPILGPPILLGAFAKLHKATVSFVMSVSDRRSAWNNLAPTGRIFMNFDVWVFFENISRKLNLVWSLTSMKVTLLEDYCTFMIISRRILLREDKSCRENKNTDFMCNNFFL
jgi:hypothetical protein